MQSSEGRPFQVEEPTTEKVQICLVEVRAKGTRRGPWWDEVWDYVHTTEHGAWWRIGWVNASELEGRGFESRSSRHVGTLGKSFTYSCLLRLGISDTVSIAVIGSASE